MKKIYSLRFYLIFISTFLLTGTSILNAQITRVEFMKVKGNVDEYLEVESEWKKAHQKRLESGTIYAWYLITRHFGGTDADYDFMNVTVYPTMGAMQEGYPQELFEGLNQDLINKTGEVRDLVRTELYDTPIVLGDG
jgi:hypothetical protein